MVFAAMAQRWRKTPWPALAALAIVAGAASLHAGLVEPVAVTIALGQPLGSNAMAVSLRTHRTFIATMMTGAGLPVSRINVLENRTGVLLPPVVVGANLLPLALDRRDDHVVVATSTPANSGIVRLLDGTTGAIVRSATLGDIPTALAVDGRTGRIFVASGSSGVCTTAECRAQPTIMRLLDASTLHVLRSVTIGQLSGDMMVDERRGRVFVPTIDGLLVLDGSSGRVRASIPGHSLLALDGRTGRVLVRDDGGMGLLDVARGRYLWFRRELVTSAVVDGRSGNVLVIPTTSNTVEVVAGANGRVLHTIRVGALPVSIALDAPAARAFVANHDDHTISVLDTASWRVRRTISVGPYPDAIIVDDGVNRVVVENTSTYVLLKGDAWRWLPPAVRHWLPFLPSPLVRSIPPVPAGSSVSLLDLAHV